MICEAGLILLAVLFTFQSVSKPRRSGEVRSQFFLPPALEPTSCREAAVPQRRTGGSVLYSIFRSWTELD